MYTTLKLEPRAGELRLSSEDLTIEGLPDELGVNGKVWLSMDGALKPARTGGKAGRKVLGKLTVNLSADVNEMIAILPGFDDAVNLINDTVIANLQGSINATVADDYAKWRVAEIAKTRVTRERDVLGRSVDAAVTRVTTRQARLERGINLMNCRSVSVTSGSRGVSPCRQDDSNSRCAGVLGAMGDGAPKIGRAAHGDAGLRAAEARAEELKERFAATTTQRQALRLASEATVE